MSTYIPKGPDSFEPSPVSNFWQWERRQQPVLFLVSTSILPLVVLGLYALFPVQVDEPLVSAIIVLNAARVKNLKAFPLKL